MKSFIPTQFRVIVAGGAIISAIATVAPIANAAPALPAVPNGALISGAEHPLIPRPKLPVDPRFGVPDVPLPAQSGKPQGYTAGQVARSYDSDLAYDYWFYDYVVSPWAQLRKDHPEVMDQNLDTVVRYNNNASPGRIEMALDDTSTDLVYNLSEAFGKELGALFRDALANGEMPKTAALLGGDTARAGGIVSSTFVEKYLYDYDRPFVAAPDRINRYHRDGLPDPYETTPSYPSGHTNKATWTASILSLMLPEFGPQLQARAAQVGESRMVMGVHYPLDVMGGRMTGNQAAADRWADPEFRPLIEEAAAEVRAVIEKRCGASFTECVAKSSPYLSDAEAVAVYSKNMTYDFPQIGEKGRPLVVPARYAGLLETRFPHLTEDQRNQVLAATAIDSGYPLDRNDGIGEHVRINMARALAANVAVNADGSITISG